MTLWPILRRGRDNEVTKCGVVSDDPARVDVQLEAGYRDGDTLADAVDSDTVWFEHAPLVPVAMYTAGKQAGRCVAVTRVIELPDLVTGGGAPIAGPVHAGQRDAGIASIWPTTYPSSAMRVALRTWTADCAHLASMMRCCPPDAFQLDVIVSSYKPGRESGSAQTPYMWGQCNAVNRNLAHDNPESAHLGVGSSWLGAAWQFVAYPPTASDLDEVMCDERLGDLLKNCRRAG